MRGFDVVQRMLLSVLQEPAGWPCVLGAVHHLRAVTSPKYISMAGLRIAALRCRRVLAGLLCVGVSLVRFGVCFW